MSVSSNEMRDKTKPCFASVFLWQKLVCFSCSDHCYFRTDEVEIWQIWTKTDDTLLTKKKPRVVSWSCDLISLLIGKYTVYMSKSNQSGHAFLIHTIIISKSYLLPPFTKAITVLKLLTWSTNGETSTRYYQNIDLHKNCHSVELRYSWMIVIVQLNLRNLTQIIIFFLAERFSRFSRV